MRRECTVARTNAYRRNCRTGHPRHVPHVPCPMTQLLKSSEKLYAQDQIWKKICKELRWEFIPSV